MSKTATTPTTPTPKKIPPGKSGKTKTKSSKTVDSSETMGLLSEAKPNASRPARTAIRRGGEWISSETGEPLRDEPPTNQLDDEATIVEAYQDESESESEGEDQIPPTEQPAAIETVGESVQEENESEPPSPAAPSLEPPQTPSPTTTAPVAGVPELKKGDVAALGVSLSKDNKAIVLELQGHGIFITPETAAALVFSLSGAAIAVCGPEKYAAHMKALQAAAQAAQAAAHRPAQRR
jgi:hypothetical protein